MEIISDVPIAVSALEVYSPSYHFIALPIEAIGPVENAKP